MSGRKGKTDSLFLFGFALARLYLSEVLDGKAIAGRRIVYHPDANTVWLSVDRGRHPSSKPPDITIQMGGLNLNTNPTSNASGYGGYGGYAQVPTYQYASAADLQSSYRPAQGAPPATGNYWSTQPAAAPGPASVPAHGPTDAQLKTVAKLWKDLEKKDKIRPFKPRMAAWTHDYEIQAAAAPVTKSGSMKTTGTSSGAVSRYRCNCSRDFGNNKDALTKHLQKHKSHKRAV